jgi:protein gp37
MTGLTRLGKSGIEYLDYAWNPYSGCRHGCSYCWARKLVNRHKNHYPYGFEPTYYQEAFKSPLDLKKPSRIGVCFMGDLFGDWMTEAWNIRRAEGADVYSNGKGIIQATLKIIEQCPRHTFLFLTKAPHNLVKWSPFPDNCWVGVSATNLKQYREACIGASVIQAKVKYISFEPLLQHIPMQPTYELAKDFCNWIIIGAQTKPYKPPKVEWVRDIVEAADAVGIPVFLKNNLTNIFTDNLNPYPSWAFKDGCYTDEKHPWVDLHLRQELPA